ncbi:hypothetical protein L1987_39447 [Smallanthus sonchifolius]|uniref:Uncharacterized protein n=1 Tax=Smallanthus sonchifolius TaxID=185202 RepID=A0ACB9HLU3_9ASTR|nr:hypothetical protein L1987_39447 [Smallanthus sonchifolius]
MMKCVNRFRYVFRPFAIHCHRKQQRRCFKGLDLDGVLPPSLAKLPYIKNIDLNRNYLNGTIPREWASTKLEYLSLESNMFSGTVPAELGNLENLVNLRLSSNNFTGRIPSLERLKQLMILEIHGSGLEGPIPASISLLSNLNELRISDLRGGSSPFPNLSNMTNMKNLYVTANSLNGSVPRWLENEPGLLPTVKGARWKSLRRSFLQPFHGTNYTRLSNLFRSYTGRNDSDLDRANCLGPCSKDQNSIHINCGGVKANIGGNVYEADLDLAGPAKFSHSSEHWGFSSTGNVLNLRNYAYAVINVSRLTMKDSELYTVARLSPLSITYYGRCLANGRYKGEIQLENFDIKNEARGVDKEVIKEIKHIHVTNKTLEIRFQYAGKGTTEVPREGVFGPLISAISMENGKLVV